LPEYRYGRAADAEVFLAKAQEIVAEAVRPEGEKDVG